MASFLRFRQKMAVTLIGNKLLARTCWLHSVVAFAALPLPVAAYGQVRSPVRVPASRQVLLADSIRRAKQIQVRTIPNVVGLSVTAAIDSLRWTRLTVVPRDSTTTKFRGGTVLDQGPNAGTPIAARVRAETLWVATAPKKSKPLATSWRDTAQIIVSRTSPRITTSTIPNRAGGTPGTVPRTPIQDRTRVPDLFGRTAPMVRAALKERRLNPGKVLNDYSDEVPSGQVFRQQPRKETEVATSTMVDVWYSIGPHQLPQTLSVPSVLGLTLVDASDSLKRSGLQSGHVDHLTERSGGGKVVHQSPHEGQAVHRNDAIDLTISDPPTPVPVPAVVGKTKTVAGEILRRAGL